MKKSRSVSVWSLLLSVGAAAALVACTPEATAPGETAVAEAVEASEEAIEPQAEVRADREGPRAHKGMHHRGGPLALFRHALEGLELDDAQRKVIEAELASFEAERPELKEKFADHHQALARAVRSGSVDEAKLRAELGGAHAEMRTRMQEAAKKLHATLRPEQRRALVDHALDKLDALADKRADGKWAKKGKLGPMKHLLGELELRDEQRAKIEAGLEALREGAPAHEERQAAMRTALESFAGESFDPSKLAPELGEHAGPAHKMIAALAVIVPTLDDAQRAQLADRLEKGPPELGKWGKKGKRHGGRHHEGKPGAERAAPGQAL